MEPISKPNPEKAGVEGSEVMENTKPGDFPSELSLPPRGQVGLLQKITQQQASLHIHVNPTSTEQIES